MLPAKVCLCPAVSRILGLYPEKVLPRDTRLMKSKPPFKVLRTSSALTVLAHFDPKEQISISCDALEVGLGVVLFHRYTGGIERPIANASKTLTDTQHRYSQVQKETLAVIYGIQKFHQFLYGQKFILVIDHKLLVALFNPEKGTPILAANSLAWWALNLSQYNMTTQ